MTTATKKASKRDSKKRAKKETAKNESWAKFFHVYRVEINPDMEEWAYCRDRVHREMLAILAKLQLDFPGIGLSMKTETSSPYEEIELSDGSN